MPLEHAHAAARDDRRHVAGQVEHGFYQPQQASFAVLVLLHAGFGLAITGLVGNKEIARPVA